MSGIEAPRGFRALDLWLQQKFFGDRFTLRAGMSVAALIIVSKRPVISIVTDKFNTFFDNTRTIR